MRIVRWRQPHLRVVCITREQDDVIDSARILSPTFEGSRMDMLGQPR
jgi:hypothetical protein